MSGVSERSRLKAAIEWFFDATDDLGSQHAREVISRVTRDQQASSAFEKFNANPAGGARIITACIESDELARTFSEKLDGEKAMRERLTYLDQAATDLMAFIDDAYRPPSDRLSASISDNSKTVADMKYGIGLAKSLIASRLRLTEETPLRLGATRKTGNTAAETAAIGWLAEAVRSTCGTPHTEATADVAQAVLRCEVSADRVKEAERTRRERTPR